MLDRRFDTFPEFRDACLAEGALPAFVMANRFQLHGHLLPDMVVDGYDIDAPVSWPPNRVDAPPSGWQCYNMLQVVCLYGDVSDIRAIVACGARVNLKTYDGESIVTLSLNNHKVLRYVISLQSCDLHSAFCTAIKTANVEAVRIFIDSGLEATCQPVTTAIMSVDIYGLALRDQFARMCRYITARGGRVCDTCVLNGEIDTKSVGYKCYLEGLDMVACCRGSSLVMLGLARVGGKVHGNGRDALRLVAREMWKTRTDDGWIEIRRGLSKKVKN